MGLHATISTGVSKFLHIIPALEGYSRLSLHIIVAFSCRLICPKPLVFAHFSSYWILYFDVLNAMARRSLQVVRQRHVLRYLFPTSNIERRRPSFPLHRTLFERARKTQPEVSIYLFTSKIRYVSPCMSHSDRPLNNISQAVSGQVKVTWHAGRSRESLLRYVLLMDCLA